MPQAPLSSPFSSPAPQAPGNLWVCYEPPLDGAACSHCGGPLVSLPLGEVDRVVLLACEHCQTVERRTYTRSTVWHLVRGRAALYDFRCRRRL